MQVNYDYSFNFWQWNYNVTFPFLCSIIFSIYFRFQRRFRYALLSLINRHSGDFEYQFIIHRIFTISITLFYSWNSGIFKFLVLFHMYCGFDIFERLFNPCRHLITRLAYYDNADIRAWSLLSVNNIVERGLS